KEIGNISGMDLVDKFVTNPVNGMEVQILPANFVDPDMGSGIVMSVPAHAPYDYIALRDLQDTGKYTNIAPICLVTGTNFGQNPAKEIIESNNIKDQNDPTIDNLTKELYSAEFSKGILNDKCGKYAGKSVRLVRDEVSNEFIENYGSIMFHDLNDKKVTCRCGNRVYVKVLDDQWSLNYADQDWKNQVHDLLPKVALVPPEVRSEFERTIDWLKLWPGTRRVGLGTKVPWDPKWMFEPLSDSTIYMSYYTIAHKIVNIKPELLTPAVFDYIFLGIGDVNNLPVDASTLKDLRTEFLYWYPYDFRCSAKDLISNHLTFQLFHHSAIFPVDLQPKGIVVFGMGLLNGMKMSSSKGNVFLLEDAIKEFGADTVRMFLIGSAEPWQDFDWRNELVLSVKKQIERLWNIIHKLDGQKGSDPMDDWLLSRLQSRISSVTNAYASFQTRKALQEAYSGIYSDLAWYQRRLPDNIIGTSILHEFTSIWIKLLTPIMPYTSEKLWSDLGNNTCISFETWPTVDPSKINKSLEISEDLLQRTVDDIQSILRLVKETAHKITIIVTQKWKYDLFKVISSISNDQDIIKIVMSNPDFNKRGKDAVDTANQIIKHIRNLPPELVKSIDRNLDEMNVFSNAAKFLEKEFGMSVEIVDSESFNHPKSKKALPFKPAIIV
ncbi:MAG TPA: leucine--tRNA ligase, partial [Methanocorpusculum sp.]|nr:leucine--tRNA ligase [Methanocorpusculum sp.]